MDSTGNHSVDTAMMIPESVSDYKHKLKAVCEDDGIKKGFYCDICEYKTIRKSRS